MIKRIAIILLLATPAVYADWMDELSQLVNVKERTLDYAQSEEVVQRLLDEDIKAMAKHEGETNATDNSFWGNVAGYFNLAKWGVAKTDSWYHEKVLDFVVTLPKNEQAHDKLVDDLIYLLNRNQELDLLLEEFAGARTRKDKITVRSYIVGKKMQIAARKKLIEKRVFIA